MTPQFAPPPVAARMPVPWTIRDLGWSLIFFVGWLAAFLLFRVAVDYFTWQVDVGLLVSVAELWLLLPVWLVLRKYGVGWSALGWRPVSASMVRFGCAALLLIYGFNLIYSTILAYFGLRMQVDLTPVLAELDAPWLFLIGGAIIAPVVEEIFFRGFLYAGLRNRYHWPTAAAISAALFALLHLSPAAIPPIFLLGFIFAMLYEKSGSLWLPISLHVLNNSVALAVVYLASRIPGLV